VKTISWRRLFLFALALAAAVQAPSVPQEKPKEKIAYEVTVSAVTIAVTVQDKGGRFINDLTQEDFRVYENKVRKPITYFSYDFEAPVGLTILLDVSGSMALQDKLTETKTALRDFLTNVLSPRDEVALLIFADGDVEVAVPFATGRAEFLSTLERLEAYGQTALNDAVAVSPEYANRVKNEKRALLLVTDGIENDSQLTPDEAVEIARRVDVPIYTIGYKIPLSDQVLQKHKSAAGLTSAGIVATLERFSRATGGKAFFMNEPLELYAALRELKKEQSHQYLIGYTSYKSVDDAYRSIRVETSHSRYRVRTREGY
jgi:VWFA-related protein